MYAIQASSEEFSSTSDVHRLDDAAGHTRRRVYTFDVSTHGCRIESNTAVGIGKFVSLQLDLESAKGYRAGTIIEAARVRWVKGHTFGLEFVKITPKNH